MARNVTRYIRTQSFGSGDGSSWANAAPLSDIVNQAALAGNDGDVWLRADEGAYYLPGTSDASYVVINTPNVRISGRKENGSPLHAVITGDRQFPYTATSTARGRTVFGIAAKIGMRWLEFRNIGRCISTKASGTTISGCQFENLRFTNVREGFTQNYDTPITNAIFRNITANGFSKGLLHFYGGSSNVLIENCFLDSEYQMDDLIATGIQSVNRQSSGDINVGNTNFTLRNVRVERCWGPVDNNYWQGDGIANEGLDINWLLQNCESRFNMDGGFDLKGNNNRLEHCVGEGNKRNYRLWGSPVNLWECKSIRPAINTNYYWGSLEAGSAGGSRHMYIPDIDVFWNGGIIDSRDWVGTAIEMESGARLTLQDVVCRVSTTGSTPVHMKSGGGAFLYDNLTFLPFRP